MVKDLFKWIPMMLLGLMAIIIILKNDYSQTSMPETKVITSFPKQIEIEKVSVAQEEADSTILSRPQSNAVRSAEEYISITGFSRDGLIEQLSSSYGDDYEIADATIAVDSLNIDWNEQAIRSAKDYLDITGFSCNGLIKQLSSSYGDRYTVSEATYGAQQAGAC